jgi:hypothetical protein
VLKHYEQKFLDGIAILSNMVGHIIGHLALPNERLPLMIFLNTMSSLLVTFSGAVFMNQEQFQYLEDKYETYALAKFIGSFPTKNYGLSADYTSDCIYRFIDYALNGVAVPSLMYGIYSYIDDVEG